MSALPPSHTAFSSRWTVFDIAMERAGELLVLALLAVIWIVPYPLTNDAATHAYNAMVSRELLFGTPGVFSEWHRLHLIPNWTATLLMIVSCGVLGPVGGVKLVLSITLVATYAALRLLARATGANVSGIGVLLFFLANHWSLWMGFFNFSLAAALALAATAYVLLRLERWTAWDSLAIAALSLLTFFTHAMPALLLAGVLLTFAAGVYLRRTWVFAWLPPPKRQRLAAAGCAGGALVLLAAFPALESAAPDTARGAILHSSLREFVQALLYFPIDAFQVVSAPFAGQGYFIGMQMLLLGAALAHQLRNGVRTALSAPLLLAGLVGLAARLLVNDAPRGMGGYVSVRLGFLTWTCLALYGWSAAPAALRSIATVAGVAVVALSLVVQAGMSGRASSAVRQIVEAAQEAPLAPGSTLVRVQYPAPEFSTAWDLHRMRVDPVLHVQGWPAASARVVDLTNYEALTWHHPNRFRVDRLPLDTQKILSSFAEHGPEGHLQNLLACIRNPATPIDAVLVIGSEHADLRPAADGRIPLEAALDGEGYRMAAARGNPVFCRVFERRERR